MEVVRGCGPLCVGKGRWNEGQDLARLRFIYVSCKCSWFVALRPLRFSSCRPPSAGSHQARRSAGADSGPERNIPRSDGFTPAGSCHETLYLVVSVRCIFPYVSLYVRTPDSLNCYYCNKRGFWSAFIEIASDVAHAGRCVRTSTLPTYFEISFTFDFTRHFDLVSWEWGENLLVLTNHQTRH